MKQSFLFIRYCVMLICFLGSSYRVKAQAINYRLVLEQQISSGALLVDIKIQKTDGGDASLGNSNFAIKVNPSLLDASGASKVATSDGPWDNDANSSNYQDVLVETGDSEEEIILKVNRIELGAGGIAIPSVLTTIGRISIPIIDCQLSGGASWVESSTLVTRWDSVDIKSNTEAGLASFVNPAPSVIPLRVVLPTTLVVSATTICAGTPITITAPGGQSSYIFYKKAADGSSTILQQASVNSINYSQTSTLADGDSLFATFTNNFCLYTTSRVGMSIQNVLPSPVILPTPSLNSGLCGNSLPPAGTSFAITALPTATTYEWEINPATAGTIAGNGTTNIVVTWNAGYTGRADIKVRGKNICTAPGIWSLVRSVRLSSDKPLKTNSPVSVGGINPVDFTCINAINNATYSVDTVQNAATYIWKVMPADAVSAAPTFVINSTGKSVATISWNRNYQGTSATIIVNARNGCGDSPIDSVRIRLRPLPPKASKPVGDSVIFCQKLAAYDKVYTTNVIPRVNQTRGYRWFVIDVTTGTNLTGVTFPDAVNGNATATPTVTVRWPADYSGQARVVVAGVLGGATGDSCSVGGSPYSFASAAIGRNLGDTSSLLVTVKPLPVAPKLPSGERGFCNVGNAMTPSSAIYTIPEAQFATGYTWKASAVLGNKVTLTALSPTSVQMTFNEVLPEGLYSIRVAGTNECSVGPDSPRLRFRVTSTVPGSADPLTGPTEVCSNIPRTIYATNAADAAGYEWTLTPTSAGTIVPAQDTTSIQDSAVAVAWTPGFVGLVTLVATPRNGCGSAQIATATITINPVPVADAGVNSVIPRDTKAILGATVAATNGLPPYTYQWFGVGAGSSLANLSNPTSPNPEFTPPTVGGTNYSYRLEVTDNKGCKSLPDTIRITVRPSSSISIKAMLEGAYVASLGKMHDSLSIATTNPLLVGGVLQRFEAGGEPVGAGFVEMTNGYTVPNEVGNKPVDVIRLDLCKDYQSSTALNTAYAWLMQDGTIRDFETGKEPVARFFRTTASTTQQYVLRVSHQNHLPIASSELIKVVPVGTPIGTTAETGFIDMTLPASVYGASPAEKKGAVLINGKAALIGADIIKTSQLNEVNAADYSAVMKAIQEGITSPVYRAEDVNMNGKIDIRDVSWTEKQSGKVYYSTAP